MSELLDYFMKMMLFDNFRRISTKMFSKVRKLSNVDFLVKEKRVKNRDDILKRLFSNISTNFLLGFKLSFSNVVFFY